MRILRWALACALLLLPSFADAAYTLITWSWAQGAGGPVSGFHVKCGRSTGSYTISINVTDPDARTVSVYTATNNERGQWYCTVDAYHTTNGTSTNGNEINFVLPFLGQPERPGGGFGFGF